jgi:hypothetical protein
MPQRVHTDFVCSIVLFVSAVVPIMHSQEDIQAVRMLISTLRWTERDYNSSLVDAAFLLG